MNSPLLNQGRQSDVGEIAVKNGATVTLAAKTPVVFEMTGTNDGFDVVRPSDTSAAQAKGFPAGILLQNLAINAIGRAAVKGVINNAKYVVRTRAGTTGTDVWASVAALSIGQPLVLDTVNNALVTATQHAAHNPVFCVAETVATIETSATGTGDSLTVSTGTVKVYLKVM